MSSLPRSDLHRGINGVFDAVRDGLAPETRRDLDRHACRSATWLALYAASLCQWTDVERILFDTVCLVDARIRDEEAS
jgi:hypothetical protein